MVLEVINSTRVAESENRLALKSMTKAINGLNTAYAKNINSIRGDTDDIYLSINPRPGRAFSITRPGRGGGWMRPPLAFRN